MKWRRIGGGPDRLLTDLTPKFKCIQSFWMINTQKLEKVNLNQETAEPHKKPKYLNFSFDGGNSEQSWVLEAQIP